MTVLGSNYHIFLLILSGVRQRRQERRRLGGGRGQRGGAAQVRRRNRQRRRRRRRQQQQPRRERPLLCGRRQQPAPVQPVVLLPLHPLAQEAAGRGRQRGREARHPRQQAGHPQRQAADARRRRRTRSASGRRTLPAGIPQTPWTRRAPRRLPLPERSAAAGRLGRHPQTAFCKSFSNVVFIFLLFNDVFFFLAASWCRSPESARETPWRCRAQWNYSQWNSKWETVSSCS